VHFAFSFLCKVVTAAFFAVYKDPCFHYSSDLNMDSKAVIQFGSKHSSLVDISVIASVPAHNTLQQLCGLRL